MHAVILLVDAVLRLATRLPSFMTRLGMSTRDKALFMLMVFSLLGLAWFIWGGGYWVLL